MPLTVLTVVVRLQASLNLQAELKTYKRMLYYGIWLLAVFSCCNVHWTSQRLHRDVIWLESGQKPFLSKLGNISSCYFRQWHSSDTTRLCDWNSHFECNVGGCSQSQSCLCSHPIAAMHLIAFQCRSVAKSVLWCRKPISGPRFLFCGGAHDAPFNCKRDLSSIGRKFAWKCSFQDGVRFSIPKASSWWEE